MASHEIQKMHDQNPKTHSEQTTQQSHVIANNKAKINNMREYLAKISPKDH
jgi:hypothetical protein